MEIWDSIAENIIAVNSNDKNKKSKVVYKNA